jgi:hypothetical protein
MPVILDEVMKRQTTGVFIFGAKPLCVETILYTI